MEILVYLPPNPIYFHFFVLHVTLAVELLLLLPFSKFAHVVYRPVALWIHRNFGTAPKKEQELEAVIMYEE